MKKKKEKGRYLVIAPVLAVTVFLVVLLGAVLANEPPRIISLDVEPGSVIPLGICRIVCHAVDPDGHNDALSYNWSFNGGTLRGEGATVYWTAPDSPGSYNITVTVTDIRGGRAMDQTTILVRIGSPPVITGLLADAAWATPAGSLKVTCTGSDPDGDKLSYEWSANAGNISGSGPLAQWTAPQKTGIYRVTVVVRDTQGSSATESLDVKVATGQPPRVESLVVTAEHCYLKEHGLGYKVGKGQEYHIKCSVLGVTDPTYQWSCDAGQITGRGSTIIWTAPSPPGSVDVTVTVVVSDSLGNTMGKSVLLNVVDCSPCTFGC